MRTCSVQMNAGPDCRYETMTQKTNRQMWANYWKHQPKTAAVKYISDPRSNSHFTLNSDPKIGSKFRLKWERSSVQMNAGPDCRYETMTQKTNRQMWANYWKHQPKTAAVKYISDPRSNSHSNLKSGWGCLPESWFRGPLNPAEHAGKLLTQKTADMDKLERKRTKTVGIKQKPKLNVWLGPAWSALKTV